MNLSIYIVDDDVSIRQILKNVIVSKELGNVVGESDNGEQAAREILLLKPDIVIVDLLLPVQDGIELTMKVKQMNIHTLFIMISQVSSKDMIAKAYESGIEYFINKPINVNEVVSVIKKVIEKLKLTETLRYIGSALNTLEGIKGSGMTELGRSNSPNIKERAKVILSQLGILGEAGSKDIIEIVGILTNKRTYSRESLPRYKTTNLYKLLKKHYKEEGNDNIYTEKAIEQRVRRAISKALRNIASIGLEDYGDYTFTTYSNTLFDFHEVRMEMDHLKGKNNYRGKINVKKFLEGIILFTQQGT